MHYLFALIFPAIYILLLLFFLFNSGAGHDWGTGAMVVLAMPLGGIGLLLEWFFPHSGLILSVPFLGLLQYFLIGLLIGKKIEQKRVL